MAYDTKQDADEKLKAAIRRRVFSRYNELRRLRKLSEFEAICEIVLEEHNLKYNEKLDKESSDIGRKDGWNEAASRSYGDGRHDGIAVGRDAEREAIVKWLRTQAFFLNTQERNAVVVLSQAIERGEHRGG